MLTIYTDGSARYATNNKVWVGAYAFTIHHNNQVIYQASFNVIPGNNDTCELLGVLNSIFYAFKNYPAHKLQICTDSKYVLNGINHRFKIKTNLKLWKLLHNLILNENIKFIHVKSHIDDNNNQVDKLAKNQLRLYYQKNYA